MAETKIGVRQGGGPHPGYSWSVQILQRAFDEAMGFLNSDQYDHLARQVKELAREDEPSQCPTVDVRPIESYYELRDKGGVLGKINARVFFFLNSLTRTIVILGAVKKESDGPTPIGDKITMRRRMRLHLEQQNTES